jgi:hypothetical protein
VVDAIVVVTGVAAEFEVAQGVWSDMARVRMRYFGAIYKVGAKTYLDHKFICE